MGFGVFIFDYFCFGNFLHCLYRKTAREASNILKDNYNSLVYSKNMVSSLEDLRTAITRIAFDQSETNKTSDYFGLLFEKGRNEFEKNLDAENKNITEIQENVYVETINKNYDIFLKVSQKIKAGAGSTALYFSEFQPAFEQLKQAIDHIHDINMQAVVRKSQVAKRDSEKTSSYMAGIGVFCLMLAFAYFWYFPMYISSSIAYLTEKMRQLVKKMGITFDSKTNDELHVILQAINLIENRLFEKSNDQNQDQT